MQVVTELEGRTLTRGMLQHYTREGLVKPRAVVPSAARGGRGRPPTIAYDMADVVLLRWLVRLNAQGIKVKRFAQGLKKLRTLVPGALRRPGDLMFFVVGKGDYAVVVPGKPSIQLTGAAGQVLLTFSSKPDVSETVRAARAVYGDKSA